MNATTVGIDLAKTVFSVHGVDAHGKVELKKTVSRGKLLECFANLSPCVIGIKACSGAHHWARQLPALGHDARIIAPRFVIPYRKSGKNDILSSPPIACLFSRGQDIVSDSAANWDSPTRSRSKGPLVRDFASARPVGSQSFNTSAFLA